MSNKVKDVSIKNQKYIFDHFINKENFDRNNIKIDEKSYWNILIYYIGYVTIKYSKYVKIDSVNSLYLIINKVDGCFEDIKNSKYLTLVPSNESKEKIKNIKNCGVKSEI